MGGENPAWIGLALAAATSIASTQMAGVYLTRNFGSSMESYSNTLTFLTGIVAGTRLLRKPPGTAVAPTVPFAYIVLVAGWNAKWRSWADQALSLAPNPGLAKIIINLNGIFAVGISSWLLNAKVTFKQLCGALLSLIGAYLAASQ